MDKLSLVKTTTTNQKYTSILCQTAHKILYNQYLRLSYGKKNWF